MAEGTFARSRLVLTVKEVDLLQRLRQSRTAPVRDVQRANILWRYHSGETISKIARELRTTRVSVTKWVNKALAVGVEVGIRDTYHRPREPVITEEAKAWVVHRACSKPKELGYAAELWSRQALADHVRRHAAAAGHPSLSRAAKATVQRILVKQQLQPHKIRYYLERRDPEFEAKMKEVMMVY